MYKNVQKRKYAKLYRIVLTKWPPALHALWGLCLQALQICTKHSLTQNLFSPKDFFHAMGNTTEAKYGIYHLLRCCIMLPTHFQRKTKLIDKFDIVPFHVNTIPPLPPCKICKRVLGFLCPVFDPIYV